MVRYSLFVLALCLLVAGGLWLQHESHPLVRHLEPPAEPKYVHASGRIEGASPDVELRFEIPGRVLDVCVHEGDLVEAGAVLMRLDSATAHQRVSLMQAELDLANAQLLRLKNGAHEQERLEAKANWESKQAELRRAQITWERAAQMRGNSVSKQDLDNHKGELDTLVAQVAAARAHWEFITAPAREDEVAAAEARCSAARAQLELSQTELAKCELKAPSSAQVAKLGHEPGELSGPTVADPAVLLVDIRQLLVRAFVEEQDASRIIVGQPVNVLLDGRPEWTGDGRVRSLAPRMSRKQLWSDQADERVDLRTREILIELDKNDGVLPGQSVDVQILVESKPGQLSPTAVKSSADGRISSREKSLP